jgi:hypothetical protein
MISPKFRSFFLSTLLILTLSGCFGEKAPSDSSDSKENNSSGKSQVTEEKPLPSAAGQKIFDAAFLKTQEPVTHDTQGKIFIGLESYVIDREQNVLPSELERMDGEILLNYDYTNIGNASGDFTADLTFNKAIEPSILFSAKLQDKKIDAILKNFDQYAAAFFGIFDLLGGEAGIQEFQKNYVGKKMSIVLNDEQYQELIQSIQTANAEGEIVVNTKDEEQQIAQAFVNSHVIIISDGTQEENLTILPYTLSAQNLISFLNEVAKIIKVENDFSSDAAFFEKLTISGNAFVKDETELDGLDMKIIADKSLLEGATQDLHLLITYRKVNSKNEWKFALLNPEKSMEQAFLKMTYEWQEGGNAAQ